MNTFRITPARMVKVTRGSRVTFTEGLCIKFGTVLDVLHDHYRIKDLQGDVRRILKERAEALTDGSERS